MALIKTSGGADPPLVPSSTGVDFRLLDETIRLSQQSIDSMLAGTALVTEIREAVASLTAARTAASRQQSPTGNGINLAEFVENKRLCLAEVERADRRVAELLDTLAAQAARRVELFAGLNKNISLIDTVGAAPRVRAVRFIASTVSEMIKMVGCDGGTYATAIQTFRTEAAPDAKAVKKPAGDRKKYAPLVANLDKATRAAITAYEKARAAREATSAAVDVVHELANTKVIEPQKPTAEEVGRYLHEIDGIARQQIPAERQAAETILTFRKLLTAFRDAVADLAPAVRKAAHLEALALDVADQAIVVSGREILEALRQELRNLVRLADDWVARQYDNSVAVTEIVEDEHEIMEQLELQVRNLGNAVANKSIARAKYDQLKDVPEDKPPKPPEFSFRGKMEFASLKATAEEHLKAVAEVTVRVDKQRAVKMVAFDAYQARREAARRVSVKLDGVATTIERTLKHPMSDELRVRLFAIRKLHKLNGGYY